MRIEIHHFHHVEPEPSALLKRLDDLDRRVQHIINVINWQRKIMDTIIAKLDQMATDAAAENTVVEGAVKMLNDLGAQVAGLKSAATDPETAAKIDALDQGIKDRTAKLAAALVAGTPATTPSAPPVTPAAADAAAAAAVDANPPSATTAST